MSQPEDLTLDLEWLPVDDPNPTTRRAVLASGDEARIYSDLLLGGWCAAAGKQTARQLASEEEARAWAAAELSKMVISRLSAARVAAEVYGALAGERDAVSERSRLIAALHDAIRLPYGQVPGSAAEWYQPEMGDQAEARKFRARVSRISARLTGQS